MKRLYASGRSLATRRSQLVVYPPEYVALQDRMVSEALEPAYFLFLAKPCQLPFRVTTGRLLNGRSCLVHAPQSSRNRQQISVADEVKGLAVVRGSSRGQFFHLRKPTVLEHVVGSRVYALVEKLSWRQQSDLQRTPSA